MKRPKVSVALDVLITVLLVVGFALLMLGLTTWIGSENHHYLSRLRSTRLSLKFSRDSIRLFFEQNGRFPKSLDELNEYGKKFPKEINWMFPPGESISRYPSDLPVHTVLDGTGGLYYNPETGVLKVNLTKPLKSYWRFYFGKRRNEVPADW